MPIYVKIEPKEELAIKKEILEANASAVSAQNNALKLSKLKTSKKSAMTGMATLIQEMQQELEKLKQALPSLENASEKEKEAEKAEIKIKTAIKPSKKLSKQPAPLKQKGKKEGYESELAALKKKISNL